MKKLYNLLGLIAIASLGLSAQTVLIPAGLNDVGGVPTTWIDAFIEADTNADGSQKNTVYQLVPGESYAFTVTNNWSFPVTIESAPREPGQLRPFIFRARRDGSANELAIYRGTADLTLRDVFLEAGNEGLEVFTYETIPISAQGSDQTVRIENCIIEQGRQSVVRTLGDGNKVFLINNILRNYGDRRRFQGNGRVVDTRNSFADSVVIKGNVIHNFLDRMFIGFRQQGLNYFEFSENTVFNHVGRHGFIQLNNTKETVIKDNFIQNPITQGTGATPGISRILSDEQGDAGGQRFIETHVFTLDTIVEGASITMSNNNVHWTEDVLNHYATFDSVRKPELFSPVFEQALLASGGTVADATFSEVVELNNVPDRSFIIDFARESVTFRDSTGITDIMVLDSLFIAEEMATDMFPNNFNFDRFDPCYDASSTSATAASDGGGVGATALCNQLWPVSIPNVAINNAIELKAMPNPASEEITFSYKNFQGGMVSLYITDMQGKIVDVVSSGVRAGAGRTVRYDRLGNLPAGMYIAVVATPSGRMTTKFVKQ